MNWFWCSLIGLFFMMVVTACQSPMAIAVDGGGGAATLAATAVPASTLVPNATTTPLPTLTLSPTTAPSPTVTPSPTATPPTLGETAVLGLSYEERPLTRYQFKNGPVEIVLVGGIHGGYEWNSIALMYAAIDYYLANPDAIPDAITLTIIPSANPDGQARVLGTDGRFDPVAAAAIPLADTVPGRFNGQDVDLNRNWDCEWQPRSNWGDRVVSGGAAPFSEPETAVLRDYFLATQPAVVIFYHSAVGGIFPGGCDNFDRHSWDLALMYGDASQYPVNEGFSSYRITGDASDWLTTQGIPAFTVELTDHTNIELNRNLTGITRMLNFFAATTGGSNDGN